MAVNKNITSLALEDNELWRRHALQLTTQVVVSLYVFVQSFRQRKGLLGPTLLMFVDGCIKYIERTWALYQASMDHFRHSQRALPKPGFNYSRLMEECSSAKGSSIPHQIWSISGPPSLVDKRALQEIYLSNEGNRKPDNSSWYFAEETDDMVQQAYGFNDMLKGLLADDFLSLEARDQSLRAFLVKPVAVAFRIIEIELNFIYDIFYTKAVVLQKGNGRIRIVCSISVTSSLFWFSIKDKRSSKYRDVDVLITFALFAGVVALEIIGVIMFLLSDWHIVFPILNRTNTRRKSFFRSLVHGLLHWSKSVTDKCPERWHVRRWSQSLKTYRLLEQCFKDPPALPFEHFYIIRRIKNILHNLLLGWFCVRTRPVIDFVGDFIFEELKKKAHGANSPQLIKEVCSARGNLALRDDYLLISEYFRPWTLDVNYDESLLTWHLATDLCLSSMAKSECEGFWNHIIVSKDISEYMSYLFLRQQIMVSPVLGSTDSLSKDSCEEAKKYIPERLNSWSRDIKAKVEKIMHLQTESEIEKEREKEEKFIKHCCQKLLANKEDILPVMATLHMGKHVLFEATRLAKQLRMLGDQQWKITAMVWVELLCYAAVRCTPRSHLAELNQGGEFITFVWLLMAHLGLSEQFREERVQWIKLVVAE